MGDNGFAMDPQSDAALVDAARSGDQGAFGQLYDGWFDRVYDLAGRIVGDRAAAADVAQDAFLNAWQKLDSLERSDAFGGWLLRIARNTALNQRRSAQRTTAVDDDTMAVIEATSSSSAGAPAGFGVEDRARTVDEPARAAEDAELAGLVWEAAEALPERDVTVLDLSLRHGLPPADIGEVIGINRNAANQLVHRVRERLGDAIRARVLWKGGSPQCPQLADELETAGVARFGPEAVRVASAHAEHCEECAERRRTRLAPAALFGAVPFAVAPALVKQQVADVLATEGVPMDGSDAGPQTVARAASRRRLMRSLTAAGAGLAAVAIVVGAIVLFGGGSADDGDAEVTTVENDTRPRRTTTTTSTTTAPAAVPPSSTPEPTSDPTPIEEGDPEPGLAPGGGAPPPPPPPPPPVAAASLTITPASRSAFYQNIDAPTLAWSTANIASVTVIGDGLSSTSLSGSLPVCPTGGSGSFCNAGPGSYTYVLTARDANGVVVATRQATLTLN